MEKVFNTSLDRAIRFAAEAHCGQMRKTDPTVPYIYHPFLVGLVLRRAGFSKDIVIAGFLHDVLEDTETTAREVERRFGKRVRGLVEAVSEDKSLEWEERKSRYHQRVMRGGVGVRAVAAADKLHNVLAILDSLEQGRNVWKFFKRDKQTTLEHYRRFAEDLCQRWDHPLSQELRSAVKKLEKKISQ